jgi:hypothetical protein
MALLIEKNVSDVLGTLDVSTLYIRLQAHLKYSGTDLQVYDKIYLDKESYLSNSGNVNVPIAGIPNKYAFEYIRDVSTTDILIDCHNKIINYLTTDHTEMFTQYDPSTGEILLDPSTGETILAPEVVIPKFCEPSEISIIDISIY